MLKRFILGVATLAAAGVVGYLLFLRGPVEQLEQARDRHVELQRQYLERLKFRPNLALIRAQIPVAKDLAAAERRILPDFDGIGAAARDFEDAIREGAKERKIASRLEFAAGDWTSREFFYERPLTVRTSGEFRQMVEFLQVMSTGSPQVRVLKSATLQPVAGRDEVALAFEVVAFRYRADEGAAAERKARTQ